MTVKNFIENRPIPKQTVLSNKQPSIHHDSSDDDDDIESQLEQKRMENSSKVKYLPPSVMKDIEQKNVARKLAGLPPILTRIRRCLACGASFQSSGNRTCGCASRVAGIIAGREII